MLKHVYSLKSVDSTNTWARKHLHTFDVNALTVIWAEEQTEGRGQRNNTWVSPPHQNLYVTFALPYIQNPFLLSQLSCLAVQKTLLLFNIQTRIKWPNDLLTDRGKISGILIEHAQEETLWGIIGIGINVQMKTVPEGIHRPVTSIYMETEKTIAPVTVLEQLTSTMQYYLGLPPEEIQAEWLRQVNWMIGTEQMVRVLGKAVRAIITEISPQGLVTCGSGGTTFTITNLE